MKEIQTGNQMSGVYRYIELKKDITTTKSFDSESKIDDSAKKQNSIDFQYLPNPKLAPRLLSKSLEFMISIVIKLLEIIPFLFTRQDKPSNNLIPESPNSSENNNYNRIETKTNKVDNTTTRNDEGTNVDSNLAVIDKTATSERTETKTQDYCPCSETLDKLEKEQAALRAKTAKKVKRKGARKAQAKSNRKQASKGFQKEAQVRSSSEGFLWKPKSDKDGRLVVLLHPSDTGKVKMVSIRSPNGRVVAKGQATGIGNGDREHFRFDKPGASFSDGSRVQIEMKDGSSKSIIINETSARYEKSF